MRIALDLGHGIGVDKGATGIIQEEEVINGVGAMVYKKLKEYGHNVKLVRPKFGITTLLQSLTNRTIVSNSFNAELFLSIHANIGGGTGSQVFTKGGMKTPLSIKILDNLNNIGFKNEGVKDGSNLYVIKYTCAESILIRLCYIDNDEDVKLYKKIDNEKIATAIVDAVGKAK